MSRITRSDLATLTLRLSRAMVARGVLDTAEGWGLTMRPGSAANGQHWSLVQEHQATGQVAYLPGLDSEQIGRTAREAYLTLAGLVAGVSMVRADNVHGFLTREPEEFGPVR